MAHGALLGLFDNLPFPLHVSPFISREKQGSDKRRVTLGFKRGSDIFLILSDSILGDKTGCGRGFDRFKK